MTSIRVEWAQCNNGRQGLENPAYAEEKKGIGQDAGLILHVFILQTGKGSQGWKGKIFEGALVQCPRGCPLESGWDVCQGK